MIIPTKISMVGNILMIKVDPQLVQKELNNFKTVHGKDPKDIKLFEPVPE